MDRRGRDYMVVRYTTTCAISAHHHLCCEFESRSWRGVLNTTLCDKVTIIRCRRTANVSQLADDSEKTLSFIHRAELVVIYFITLYKMQLRNVLFSFIRVSYKLQKKKDKSLYL
jgi:hypothetical protein